MSNHTPHTASRKIWAFCLFYSYSYYTMENYKEKLPRWLKHEAESKKAEIQQSIADYKACIEILESIKRTHKKDGTDFQNLFKNFDYPENVRIWWRNVVYSKYWEINWYLNGCHEIHLEAHQMGEEVSANTFEAEIKQAIENYKRWLADAENDLLKWDGELDKLASITETLGEFLDNLESGNDYKLRETLKKVL